MNKKVLWFDLFALTLALTGTFALGIRDYGEIINRICMIAYPIVMVTNIVLLFISNQKTELEYKADLMPLWQTLMSSIIWGMLSYTAPYWIKPHYSNGGQVWFLVSAVILTSYSFVVFRDCLARISRKRENDNGKNK